MGGPKGEKDKSKADLEGQTLSQPYAIEGQGTRAFFKLFRDDFLVLDRRTVTERDIVLAAISLVLGIWVILIVQSDYAHLLAAVFTSLGIALLAIVGCLFWGKEPRTERRRLVSRIEAVYAKEKGEGQK